MGLDGLGADGGVGGFLAEFGDVGVDVGTADVDVARGGCEEEEGGEGYEKNERGFGSGMMIHFVSSLEKVLEDQRQMEREKGDVRSLVLV